jgi:hypothetical protein
VETVVAPSEDGEAEVDLGGASDLERARIIHRFGFCTAWRV